jgi:hypothetical protein
MMGLMQKSPQPDNAKPMQAAGAGGGMGAIMQNGQPGNVGMTDADAGMGAGQDMRADAQPAETFAGAM